MGHRSPGPASPGSPLPAPRVETQLDVPALPRPPGSVAAAIVAVAEYPVPAVRLERSCAASADTLVAEALPKVLVGMAHWVPGPRYIEPWDRRFSDRGPRCRSVGRAESGLSP